MEKLIKFPEDKEGRKSPDLAMMKSNLFYCASFLLVAVVGLPMSSFSQDFDLTLGEFDPCALSLPISWEAHTDWPGEVGHYEVWASQKSPASDFPGPAVLVGTVAGNVTTYDFLADDGRQHCLQILAISTEANDTVRSDLECLDIPIVQFARNIIIESVSLDPATPSPNGLVQMIWETAPPIPLQEATVFRSRDGGSFEPIGQLDPTFPFFIDSTANAHLGPVSYQIRGVDDCGNELTSNRATTIFLQGDVNEQGVAVLEWTPYQNEYYFDDLEYHVLTEIFPGSIDFQTPEAVYSPDIYIHTEQIDLSSLNSGSNCYTIIVEPRLSREGFFYFNSTAFSNQVCLSADLPIFIPNAFAPDGVNQEFKVYSPFESSFDYFIRIFDRYGNLLFESQDIEQGWDGTSNGKPLPAGVYVYLIEIERSDQKTLEKKGSVVLVR